MGNTLPEGVISILDTQIHIYSVDTSAFYTDKEKEYEVIVNRARAQKTRLKEERTLLQSFFSGHINQDKAESRYRQIYNIDRKEPVTLGTKDRFSEIADDIRDLNAAITSGKQNLIDLLSANTDMRILRNEYVSEKNIVSVFESMLTRTLGMNAGELYDDFFIVRTYYFDVLKSLILNGFMYNGEKYICFTASAGQIRTKKTVFIKKSLWDKHQRTLMCGLTVDKINATGGININKYLAYLALCNSATDLLMDFDIKKSIVVDDMETVVTGIVDFIDHKTYQITRKEMDIPITHTDGCGMMLPRVSKKNMMVRLPWVKGLLASFPFDKFIREADLSEPDKAHGVIKDIYGVEHDVLKEDIEFIFTKSQFKMYGFYDNWQQYIDYFIEFGCSAGKCNEEDDFLLDARLNYQMLQTLTDITDDELNSLAFRSVDKITHIAVNRDTMLNVFGARKDNLHKNYFQKCLQIYPELLSDPYSRELLKQIKKSMVEDAKAAKLDIQAKYMFLIPDLYAFCEWLFLGDKNPKGLLKDGEVSCNIYKQFDKLDCLRSPHLFREHAVRRNVVSQEMQRWFSQRAIYTSCHDLISKILQFDCDGDKSLVCAEPLLVEIAGRNMRDIVPLYYEMAKAGHMQITEQQIYDGMIAAYTGGNIGVISNDITKIWNDTSSDTVDLDAIKILCMNNNFSIDYAKTLYKPTMPDEIKSRIGVLTRAKTPYFFIHAKGKSVGQVEKINNSVVNRLEQVIPNKRMSFSAQNIGEFNYHAMMKSVDVATSQDIIDLYNKLEREYRYKVSCFDDDSNSSYLRDSIRKEFEGCGLCITDVCDVLIKHLFCEKSSRRKSVFWMCFGDIVYDNLTRNISEFSKQCVRCGRRFMALHDSKKDLSDSISSRKKYCDKCARYQPIGKKEVVCVDCGNIFEVDSRNTKKIRCDSCQAIYRKKWDRKRKSRV